MKIETLTPDALSSTYFEKKSDGKYGLKSIPMEWFPAGSRILSGSLSVISLYTTNGNAVRLEIDITYSDKGIVDVEILDNRGVFTAGMFYWVKAGTSINVIAKMLMNGSKDIEIGFTTIIDNTLIIYLNNVSVYSALFVRSDKPINTMYAVNI